MLPHEKPIFEYEKTLQKLKEQNGDNSPWSNEELAHLEEKLHLLKTKVYSELTPWQRVAICRHPRRPKTLDYIENICDNFTEIFGDRLYGDDHAVIAGFASIGGVKFMVIGQEKGNDTKSRIHRNFGMPYPEGYRKAMRCMRLAAKFNLPVITFLDTPGAYPGLAAEERGQGWAIANNLWEMARLPTPILVLVIGEGCSGGALGMGIGDVVAMLQHSYYSVISPEGCASILWKDTSKNEVAAKALKMHAEDLLELGVIDLSIEEPMGGAQHDTGAVYKSVKNFISEQWDALKTIPIDELLERRYQKFRRMGNFAIEDKATVL